MFRFSAIMVLILIIFVMTTGCSGNANNPIAPSDLSQTAAGDISGGQTHLWGYYEIEIDIPTQTVIAVPLRHAMFTANVTKFVNGKPSNLGFHINDMPVGADYIDVDIDVTITHPFPGLPQYNGYDVRGVFMGNWSKFLDYNADLVYSVNGTDQFMMADPDDGIGGPDGYTRWFNAPEFSTGGMPLFQYTPGKVATPQYFPTATLNPYKYFADSLSVNDDLWSWLENNPDGHGVFSSGASNTGNYYLRFPKSGGVKYAYAIIASWKGTDPADHPSNADEAVACKVDDNSDVWFVDQTQNGGNLNFDISLWDWNSQVSAGVMDDYQIFIESTVLSSVYQSTTSDMTPIGGNENYSTYHIEIPADSINGTTGNEYWIIARDANLDYTNEFGVSNLADKAPLAAFFRFDLAVGNQADNNPPICDLEVEGGNPVEAWEYPIDVTFDATGCYDPDPGDSIALFEWDLNGNGVYNESPEDEYQGGNEQKPIRTYTEAYAGVIRLRITDTKGGVSICEIDPFVVEDASCDFSV
ncbi:MAG: hypothetical protein ABIC40_05905, partial [bacterium]